ncbi:AAA family ATPase [Succinivibrio dextrinosolvens]|uniref:PD-(D/E)XK nuclease superfamily protein n=1 Tax=Succinivibrio dextrinosolvens TaxID=83771 RepID=A0A662ZCZ4_9GAMM|nr:AAA family ATPase [Succinivibrio dextrinosolvens]SFK51122.1 PD-(D/E)XK nuclease superfamily protein [Succinivibrio dextrinosolvens]
MALKKIIVGMCTLSEIRDKDGIYIDKTRFIDYLENDAGTSVPVFLRPRRFGKSLTASMLHSYYDISEKDQFEKNFKGTWIYDHRTPLASSYYVIHFDFSNVASDYSRMNDSFLRSVSYSINSFSSKYPERGLTKDQRDISLFSSAPDLLGAFLDNFSNRAEAGEYLYVIIDEYDHFANEILTRDKEAFKDITSTAEGHEGLIKQFYAQLKAYYRGNRPGGIDRFFITGVSSVSLDSVTSGFNIATNISLKSDFHEMIGFTHAELSEVIDETVDFSLLSDITKEQVMQIMEENFDGYAFEKKAKEKMFNSNLCLAYLESVISERELPNPNEISLNDDVGKLRGMLNLCENNVREEIVQAMFNKEPIDLKLPDKMNLNSTNYFDKAQMVSLLYHLGYLTIDTETSQKKGITSFVIPNRVYENLFLDYCRMSMGYSADAYKDLSPMFEESADITPLIQIITEQIETKLNPQSLGKFTEMALQLICDSIINNSIYRKLSSYTEFNTGKGFADIFVKNTYPNGHYFLLELKYLHKKDDSKSSIDAKLAEAKEEIERYRQGTILKEKVGNHPLDCYAIIFVGSECRLCQKI